MTVEITVLSEDGLMRFLRHHNGAKGCQLCGSESFDCYNEIKNRSAAYIPARDRSSRDEDKTKTIDVYVITCNNCFNIRTYARTPILKWLTKNRPTK